jgi:hypothetical protein
MFDDQATTYLYPPNSSVKPPAWFSTKATATSKQADRLVWSSQHRVDGAASSSRSVAVRGDLFLWVELRQALCHVPVPVKKGALEQVIRCAYEALVGQPMDSSAEVYVPRLARGGMSSGMVSSEFWSRSFIPTIELRRSWLISA